MRSTVLLINLFVCVSSTHGLTTPLPKGEPWPMPMSYKPTATVISLNKDLFHFVNIKSDKCDLLTDAFSRYKDIIFGKRSKSLKFQTGKKLGVNTGLSVLFVKVTQSCATSIDFESDESYNLTITADGATLAANQTWGALRGLETFSQLVYQAVPGEFSLNLTTIVDKPRFKHRSVLLDSSRHYLTKEIIFKNLNAMAQNKFNVFHWHIVDDESFPYVSAKFPKLSGMGAYNNVTHVYSPGDVHDVINYAFTRGIRVMVEFDTPGHTQSWGKGQPGLLTPCYNKDKADGTYGPVDPSNNDTFTFFSQFFQEVATTFPDQYIFLGGDEVSFNCWKSNPTITAFMTKMKFGTDYGKLEQFFMQKIIDIVAGQKKSYMIWQEVIDNGAKVSSDTIVGVWKGGWQGEVAKVTSQGYKVVVSAPWYLNLFGYPGWGSLSSEASRYYKTDPQDFKGTDAQKALVIGGETAIWGEWVDSTNVIPRFWPRASTVAERLWSPASVNDVNEMAPRLAAHRCRMVRRGINAEPITKYGHCDVEFTMG